MGAALKKLGYKDFLKFPEDGNRHEVIRGEWVMTPPPNMDHQAVVLGLGSLLFAYVRSHKLGRVDVAPSGVRLGRNDVVQPDLLFVTEARTHIVRKEGVLGAPDLVVEVLSPSTAEYDRHEKLVLYQDAGVREYWMVDPAARTIEIREFGRVRRTRMYQEGQEFTSKLLPGLTIKLAEVFSGIH